MPISMTKSDHADLKTRLEVLVSEYAAASDRQSALAKLDGVLSRVDVTEDPVPAAEPAQAEAPAEASPEPDDQPKKSGKK